MYQIMRIWSCSKSSFVCLRQVPRTARCFSTRHHERVEVRCGSSGHVAIDLFNVANNSPNAPLIIHLPPFPTQQPTNPQDLPSVIRDWPVASINYRWHQTTPQLAPADNPHLPIQWPCPVHDVGFAYAWLTSNLRLPDHTRRDIYVYGSYVGGSLAASLALTQTTPHARIGVRGMACFNGIYNWTMFLPDHPVHKKKTRKSTSMTEALTPPPLVGGAQMEELLHSVPDLFHKPADLFDAFASPSLLFHNPGLHIPSSFDQGNPSMVDKMMKLSLNKDENSVSPEEMVMKPARKSHLVFPPRDSTIKIPQTLLIHTAPIVTDVKKKSRKKHTFEAQAEELADLMRRSIEKVEFKERQKWDDTDSWEEAARQRVRLQNIGEEADSIALPVNGEEALIAWLEDIV
ncbi:uncharacterized protein F5Z01DRAFT_488989 [Emericellopsis atlantica]|uniref:Alpha/beta hydrolase fold-3 domain-containing protein n=1 Tax=Emericellopsis atlantica TaxID=2614577 RepID=A0A9P7ZR62_9HYPO|nr:uncharacterized protein F5Z01DRAFT_488989 [Emericellopsis atlantica]KAG9256809.1 hypothetical protein F5Z01DRAFT_488989 [Emericellopsis atlantica]